LKSNMSFDFLSANFLFNLNWISNPSRPGVFDFFFTIARSVVFAWIVFLFLYLVEYRSSGVREFSRMELAGFVVVYALFEEQSRWIFSSVADNPGRACTIFFIFIVVAETTSFWMLSPRVDFVDYIMVRSGSVIVHGINAWICYMSMKCNFKRKIILFSVAVAFHVYMNYHGARALAELLLDR